MRKFFLLPLFGFVVSSHALAGATLSSLAVNSKFVLSGHEGLVIPAGWSGMMWKRDSGYRCGFMFHEKLQNNTDFRNLVLKTESLVIDLKCHPGNVGWPHNCEYPGEGIPVVHPYYSFKVSGSRFIKAFWCDQNKDVEVVNADFDGSFRIEPNNEVVDGLGN